MGSIKSLPFSDTIYIIFSTDVWTSISTQLLCKLGRRGDFNRQHRR